MATRRLPGIMPDSLLVVEELLLLQGMILYPS